MRKILLITLASTFSLLTFAKDIHVPKDYTKIQSAINASVDGDKILIASGVYFENLNINKSITLIGNGSCTIAKGDLILKDARNSTALVNITDNEVNIENINFQGQKLAKTKTYSSPACRVAIDAKDALLNMTSVNFEGFTHSFLTLDGGYLEITKAIFSKPNTHFSVPKTAFILEDVGGVTMKKIKSVNSKIEYLFAINETFTGSRKSILMVSDSELRNTKLDRGRKESYTLYASLDPTKTYPVTSKPTKPVPTEEDPDAGLSTMHDIPLPRKPAQPTTKTGITFHGDQLSFTNVIEGKKYQYNLPDKVQYKEHKSTRHKLAISYVGRSDKANYLGIWNSKLEYVSEYNFGQIKVLDFELENTILPGNDITLVYYNDIKNKTFFVGVFDQYMKYLGQYELTGSKNIHLTFSKGSPVVTYNFQGQNWKVVLSRSGTVLKKTKN